MIHLIIEQVEDIPTQISLTLVSRAVKKSVDPHIWRELEIRNNDSRSMAKVAVVLESAYAPLVREVLIAFDGASQPLSIAPTPAERRLARDSALENTKSHAALICQLLTATSNVHKLKLSGTTRDPVGVHTISRVLRHSGDSLTNGNDLIAPKLDVLIVDHPLVSELVPILQSRPKLSVLQVHFSHTFKKFHLLYSNALASSPGFMTCFQCVKHTYPTRRGKPILSTMIDQPLLSNIIPLNHGIAQLEEIIRLRSHSEHACVDFGPGFWSPQTINLLKMFISVKTLHICSASRIGDDDHSNLFMDILAGFSELEDLRWIWGPNEEVQKKFFKRSSDGRLPKPLVRATFVWLDLSQPSSTTMNFHTYVRESNVEGVQRWVAEKLDSQRRERRPNLNALMGPPSY